jgi:hypothetical protein
MLKHLVVATLSRGCGGARRASQAYRLARVSDPTSALSISSILSDVLVSTQPTAREFSSTGATAGAIDTAVSDACDHYRNASGHL